MSMAQAAPPSNNSPHHFTLVSPDQIEKEEPPLNECRKTRAIGMNMNSRTNTAQAPIDNFMPSKRRDCSTLSCRTRAVVRACIDRRTACVTGWAARRSQGTIKTTNAPTVRARSTAPIMRIAIAEPSGQFCACENCEAIIEPIMLPLAPPNTVAVT